MSEMIERCVRVALSVHVSALELGKQELTVEDVTRAKVLVILSELRDALRERRPSAVQLVTGNKDFNAGAVSALEWMEDQLT